MFFHAYMYGPLQGKLRLYSARGVKPGGAVMSSDWEVFASILVRDIGKKLGSGIDLSGYEVKSAEGNGAYEYQYHKNTGQQKLKDDMKAGHLFFNHSNGLRFVELRYAHGSTLKFQFFEKWLNAYPDPYPQRYRKSVSFSWVKRNGTLLMVLKDGEVAFPTSMAQNNPEDINPKRSKSQRKTQKTRPNR